MGQCTYLPQGDNMFIKLALSIEAGTGCVPWSFLKSGLEEHKALSEQLLAWLGGKDCPTCLSHDLLPRLP